VARRRNNSSSTLALKRKMPSELPYPAITIGIQQADRTRTEFVRFPRPQPGLRLCREVLMPEKKTVERAREDAHRGESPATQAGEFVREEIHHVREGKHGARSTPQVVAIGLSKARRAGVKLPAPAKGKASARTRRQGQREYRKGRQHSRHKPSRRRSRAVGRALKREGPSAASRDSLSRQARAAARKRSSAARRRSAARAVRTKGKKRRSRAVRKAAPTRRGEGTRREQRSPPGAKPPIGVSIRRRRGTRG
jgi:hypothetical protein